MVQQRRSLIALLGVFALLLQGLLFGWHHHPLPLSSMAHAPTVAAASAAPLLPQLDDEDHCELCATLHHLSYAPGEVANAAIRAATSAGSSPGEPILVARHPVWALQARAPPLT